MKSAFVGIILVVASSWTHHCNASECIKGPTHLYSGTHSTTKSGITCQRWDVDKPHLVKNVPKDGGHHNYCRNPDRDSHGTWCYTTDPSKRWDYCGLPQCEDSAMVIWTSFDDSDNSSFLEAFKADPEYASRNSLGLSDISEKVFKNAQLSALAVSQDGREIYFVDVRNDYFGVMNTETFEIERYLEGKASGIHSIAQDFATGNFYYTDTSSKSVMVADRAFKAQVSIYNTAPADPKGIAVLQGERRLIFSTYVKINTKIRGAKIIKTDLSGNNEQVLFKSPEVKDVTALVADDQRIYWADNLGWASRIESSLLDGSDKIEHYFKKSSSFQNLALYTDYIYVTDSQIRYNYFDHVRYHVQAIVKDRESNQVYTYTRPHVPHGIAIIDENNEENVQGVVSKSLERCLNTCQGVCIPNKIGRARCACSAGYRYQRKRGECVKPQLRARFEERSLPKKKSQRS